MTDATDPYRDAALEQVWRLAALVDRNPHSPTRGSCSRTHWAWKFSDFPYPRMQEGVCALVRLYDLDDPRNPLHRSPAVEDWVRWGFEYWASLQHASGAYDEAYPNEQCLAATAFTSFYLGQAFLRWRDRLAPDLRSRLESAFVRAGAWLCRHDETHGILSNHLAAAAAGLETIARIAADAECSRRAEFFLDRILEHQSPDGWLLEYDGADIGYGTHAFFYLAELWKMTGSERTRAALDRFADFLAYFVHPDGTIGGEYGSRNTEFYYPAGFERLAPASAAAASIAAGMRAAIAGRRVCGVWSMDDFNFMPMLNNLLFAAEAASPGGAAPPLPWQRAPFERYFEHGGLWVVNRDRFYAIVGLSKGGTVSLFDKTTRHLCARHAGLIGARGSRRFTTQDHVLSPPVQWDAQGTAVSMHVPWKSLRTVVFTPRLFLAFRAFTLTLGRIPAISRRLKALLVHALIRRKVRPAIAHTRRIALRDDGVEIADDLVLPAGMTDLRAEELFTSVHMGSAMYADVRSPGVRAGVDVWAVPAAGRLRLRGQLTTAGTAWIAEDL